MVAVRERAGQRPRRPVENAGYAEMMRRCIRALGKRIAGGDVEDIATAVQLRDELDAAIKAGVTSLREGGESWERIGRALGMTKQAAQQRWGR